jgi:hypothetical protein
MAPASPHRRAVPLSDDRDNLVLAKRFPTFGRPEDCRPWAATLSAGRNMIWVKDRDDDNG